MSPISLEALEGLIGRLFTLGLIHSLWIGLLAASFASIVFQTWPRLSHRARHRLLWGSIGWVVCGPILAVVIQRNAASSNVVEDHPEVRVTLAQPREKQSGPAPTTVEAASHPAQPERERFVSRLSQAWSRTRDALIETQPFALAAWLLGVSILSARLLVAGFSLRGLVRASNPISPSIQTRADTMARRLKLRRTPPTLVHPELIEPGLCGLFRPKILLPARWMDTADLGWIDAILAHELAHARRLDLPANLVQRLVETALFFHPAVHWLSRALRRERELCADALATTLTGDPISLAHALESVARLRLNAQPDRCRVMTFGTSFGGDNPSLLPRIQELLGMTPNTPARRSYWPWASLLAACSIALLGASLSLAEDPNRPVPTVGMPTIDVAPVPASSRNPLPLTKVPLRPRTYVDRAVKPSRLSPPTRGYYSDRQINYEVRIMSVSNLAWRDSMAGRLREVHRDSESNAWIIDDDAAGTFLTTASKEPISPIHPVLLAPKVTAFEGDQVMITFKTDKKYVAELESIENTDTTVFRPITKSFDFGGKIAVSGLIRRDSIQMDVDLRDTRLVTMYRKTWGETARRKSNIRPESPRTYSELPILTNKHFKGIYNIPKGSSLLISAGFDEYSKPIPPVMDNVIEIVRTILGGPRVEAERIILERIVMITPRRILLEFEENELRVKYEEEMKRKKRRTPNPTHQPIAGQKTAYFDTSASANY
jgi:beta-lactamase regulating signal transducer with metallopeptidase domain